jgi:hypothetical protein
VFDVPRDEWDDTVYSRAVSEREHRSGRAPPRQYYRPERTPGDDALAHAVAWFHSRDWRKVDPPPLPESGPLPPLPGGGVE